MGVKSGLEIGNRCRRAWEVTETTGKGEDGWDGGPGGLRSHESAGSVLDVAAFLQRTSGLLPVEVREQ